MGKKNRRNRSHSHDESDEDGDASSDQPHGDDSNENTSNTNTNMKDLDFKQRQELQRQQAAEKRRHKQKCHLCGKSGHVRRECPGILDDGRGMSRYKGKSDPASAKARYENMKNDSKLKASGDAPPILAAVQGMEWPKGFGKEQQQDDHPFVYYDAGSDVQATLDYVKSGRGKAKMISQKEALHEYLAVMQHAHETSNYGGMISRSLLKPNRPWMKPALDHHDEQSSSSSSSSEGNDKDFNLWYVVGLHRDFLYNDTLETAAIQALMETYQQNTDCVAGFFCDLDYHEEFLKRPGCDRESQLRRLKCTCQAAGETNQTIAIRTSPGAAGLLVFSSEHQPEQSLSLAGTQYAQVLLDLQTQLSETLDTFPSLNILLSCWSGRADHMTSICNAFPNNNIYIGLDGSVSFSKATHLHECAFDCPMERLVLETSTVIPASVANALGRDAFFHSATVPFLAEAVAHCKKMVSAPQVARIASQNTLTLYPQLRADNDSSKITNTNKVDCNKQDVQGNGEDHSGDD
jgi:Tat protein secretion system quality control protein TatD with DNase activity